MKEKEGKKEDLCGDPFSFRRTKKLCFLGERKVCALKNNFFLTPSIPRIISPTFLFFFCVCLVGGWQHLFFSFWYEWQVEKRREPFSSIVALPPFLPNQRSPPLPTQPREGANNGGIMTGVASAVLNGPISLPPFYFNGLSAEEKRLFLSRTWKAKKGEK